MFLNVHSAYSNVCWILLIWWDACSYQEKNNEQLKFDGLHTTKGHLQQTLHVFATQFVKINYHYIHKGAMLWVNLNFEWLLSLS